MSSFLAIALILEAREAPFEVAEGMLPRDTILIESLLLLLSSFCDCCARQSRCINSQAAKLSHKKAVMLLSMQVLCGSLGCLMNRAFTNIR